MDINYTWKITDLYVAPSSSGQTNVVLRAAWELIGTYTAPDGTEYSHTYNSMTVLPAYEEGASFTSFEDVTPQHVQTWIEAKENTKKRDIAWIKANKIVPGIEEKVNPTVVMISNWSN
jgi:hypothetical protein